MDALVMCGGRGSRLQADCEKPLLQVEGTALVDGVVASLRRSRVDRILAVVSPQTPETRRHLIGGPEIEVVDGTGDGYVADLDRAVARTGRPVLTVAADLPLLAPEHVNRTLSVAADTRPARSVTVRVPAVLKRRLGASVDRVEGGNCPTGLNVVGTGAERTVTSEDPRLAVNVNRPGDGWIAAALARNGDV